MDNVLWVRLWTATTHRLSSPHKEMTNTRLGDTDLEFLVEVVLFGGEVEAGHGESPVRVSAEW